jgi:hypothetical protein
VTNDDPSASPDGRPDGVTVEERDAHVDLVLIIAIVVLVLLAIAVVLAVVQRRRRKGGVIASGKDGAS